MFQRDEKSDVTVTDVARPSLQRFLVVVVLSISSGEVNIET